MHSYVDKTVPRITGPIVSAFCFGAGLWGSQFSQESCILFDLFRLANDSRCCCRLNPCQALRILWRGLTWWGWPHCAIVPPAATSTGLSLNMINGSRFTFLHHILMHCYALTSYGSDWLGFDCFLYWIWRLPVRSAANCPVRYLILTWRSNSYFQSNIKSSTIRWLVVYGRIRLKQHSSLLSSFATTWTNSKLLDVQSTQVKPVYDYFKNFLACNWPIVHLAEPAKFPFPVSIALWGNIVQQGSRDPSNFISFNSERDGW